MMTRSETRYFGPESGDMTLAEIAALTQRKEEPAARQRRVADMTAAPLRS
jgi:hypothetical protein